MYIKKLGLRVSVAACSHRPRSRSSSPKVYICQSFCRAAENQTCEEGHGTLIFDGSNDINLCRRRWYVDISMPKISVPWQVRRRHGAAYRALHRRHWVHVDIYSVAGALGRNADERQRWVEMSTTSAPPYNFNASCACHCIRILSTAKTTFCSHLATTFILPWAAKVAYLLSLVHWTACSIRTRWR